MFRFIILLGLCLVVISFLVTHHVVVPWFGHLPGDITLNYGTTELYVPFTTAILVSIALSIIISLFSR